MNQQELKKIILSHYRKYPHSSVQDFIKLLYQNEFGGGHFVADEAASLERLENEIITLHANKFYAESIGNGRARLHLVKKPPLAIDTIHNIFLQSSKEATGKRENLAATLDVFLLMLKDKVIDLSYPAAKCEIQEYLNQKSLMRSHSENYRNRYTPAYRIVLQEFSDYIPLFILIEEKLKNKKPIIVSIEGGSASGKTTLANRLSQLYDANIIPMDSFFLRPKQRTVRRYQEIGGNIDYERFYKEITLPLKAKREFSYRPFSCNTMEFGEKIQVTPKQLTIIEGVYSTHPKLSLSYDINVFLEVSPERQKERLLKRNPHLVNKFVSQWIPMEQAYFDTFHVKKSANVIFSNNKNV